MLFVSHLLLTAGAITRRLWELGEGLWTRERTIALFVEGAEEKRLLALQIRGACLRNDKQVTISILFVYSRQENIKSARRLLETLTKETILNSVTSACRVFKG